jgi:Circularly permutated YpsA SLOG family
VTRITSGGQTGADRAAVDFAIAFGIDYGGVVPLGGWAEDFPEPPGLLARYVGFREAASVDPSVRIEMNVRDSDATLVLEVAGSGPPSPGTQWTKEVAGRLGRPWTAVDPSDLGGVAALEVFLDRLAMGITLNVAGPRASESPGLYRASLAFLSEAAALFLR